MRTETSETRTPTAQRAMWVAITLMLIAALAACAGGAAGEQAGDEPVSDTTESPGEDTRSETADESGDLMEVTLVHPSGPALIPLYYQSAVAKKLGFWEEEGLDVNIVGLDSGSAGAIQQLVAGNGDISNESPQVVFDAIEEGFGDTIRIIGTWLYEQPFSLRTYPDSDIDSIEDLEGKTIGISEAAGGEVTLLEATLDLYGITDYELLPIGDGGPQTIRALENREVDAYSTAAKDFLGLEAEGVELKLVSIPEWENLTANVFTTRTEFLEENRDAVIGYLRGLAKATLFAFENTEAAVEITASYQEEGVPDYLVEGWVRQTLDQSVPLELIEAGTPFATPLDQLQEFLDFYKQAGAIGEDVNIDLEEYVVEEIAREAGDFDREAIRQLAEDYEG